MTLNLLVKFVISRRQQGCQPIGIQCFIPLDITYVTSQGYQTDLDFTESLIINLPFFVCLFPLSLSDRENL